MSQMSQSPPDRSPQCGSQTTCSEFETPRHDELELNDELSGWLSRLSGDDWLEEELGYQLDSPPLPSGERLVESAPYSQCRSGLARSTSEQVELPSPVRGSLRPQRCSTFRTNSYPQMNAPLRGGNHVDGYDREKAFCMKRLAAHGPRPAYGTDSANLAEAVNAILAEARNGGA